MDESQVFSAQLVKEMKMQRERLVMVGDIILGVIYFKLLALIIIRKPNRVGILRKSVD